MALIRINAIGTVPVLHGVSENIGNRLNRYGREDGPAIIMIHGFKYQPGHQVHCPHRHIMSLEPEHLPWRPPSWPRHLGFGLGNTGEGIAIAFGWQARGPIWQAKKRACEAGLALAKLVDAIKSQNPARPVHVIAHSLGSEIVLESLYHLPGKAIDRIIVLNGASFKSRAQKALATLAGRSAELINVTSRENDLFDFLFERVVRSPERGDRAIGFGIDAPNAVTLQLDCIDTLDHIAQMGAYIGLPQRRICHWSAYMRPGVLRFYNDLLRRPDVFRLAILRQGVPDRPHRRWSRLFAWRPVTVPLPEWLEI